MDEQQILEIDRQGDVPNCAITSYRAQRGHENDAVLQLDLVNFVAPLREAATPVTTAPDRPVSPKPCMAAAAAKARALTPAVFARWPLPDAGDTADKESRGHVLVVAGSHEMPGAALLAAVAALRTGAGKLTIAAPGRVAEGLALAVPEARVLGLAESRAGGLLQAGCKAL